VSSYRERIDWIMRNRHFKSGRALSMTAGLSPATVNNLLMRERREGSASLDAESLAAIAAVAKVDPQWLATGAGEPEPGAGRVYESDRDRDRRGSLVNVREKLYSRYEKSLVDQAIGASDFIGAEEINELEAFDYFDRLLATQARPHKKAVGSERTIRGHGSKSGQHAQITLPPPTPTPKKSP
jgi:phage repressor protein C with HTH and peptisase S24 domain